VSTSVKGYVITLENDVKNERADYVLNALRMVKGVASVEPIQANPSDFVIEQRLRLELLKKITEVIYK
jgi:hypothetical protein